MDKATINFQEFVTRWNMEIIPNKAKDIRLGQSLMNYLHEIWREEYVRISSVHYYDQTNIDCFYVDDLIPNTLKHLEKVWKN